MNQWNRPLLFGLVVCALVCGYVAGSAVRAEDSPSAAPTAIQTPITTSALPETTSWGYLPIPKGSSGQVLYTDPAQVYGYCIAASEKQVRAFYEREMAADGWSYLGERTTDAGVQWLYLRDDAAGAVSVQALDQYAYLFVQLTFADHLPGEPTP